MIDIVSARLAVRALIAEEGVDPDPAMLEAARERGLNVSHGDAIQSLQSLASESQKSGTN